MHREGSNQPRMWSRKYDMIILKTYKNDKFVWRFVCLKISVIFSPWIVHNPARTTILKDFAW